MFEICWIHLLFFVQIYPVSNKYLMYFSVSITERIYMFQFIWTLFSYFLKNSRSILLSLGCHNKIIQTEWLEQQKFVILEFWRPEVRLGPQRGPCAVRIPSSWLAHGPPSCFGPHVSSVHLRRRRRCGANPLVALHKVPTFFTSSNPDYSPRTSVPNTITLDHYLSIILSLYPMYEFRGRVTYSVHSKKLFCGLISIWPSILLGDCFVFPFLKSCSLA